MRHDVLKDGVPEILLLDHRDLEIPSLDPIHPGTIPEDETLACRNVALLLKRLPNGFPEPFDHQGIGMFNHSQHFIQGYAAMQDDGMHVITRLHR